MSEWQPCYDRAESQQHLDDLRLAHDTVAEGSLGRPIPASELEKLGTGVVAWFAEWAEEKQLAFLSDLPVGESARLIERLEAGLRELLLAKLSSERREALKRHWAPKGELSTSV